MSTQRSLPLKSGEPRQALLQVDHMSVSYGKIEAVRHVSIVLQAGEIAAVIGPNGAGKSSLLNAMMLALPATGVVQGQVWYQGQNISNWPIEQRVQQGLSLVPEKRELFASMTVEENLKLGAYVRRLAGERNYLDQLDVVYDLFERLKERAKQQAGTLSGGERQMLAVGRALMAKPNVLMLDEPSLGLAPLIVKDIFTTISRLRTLGVAILLVEQNARMALQTADYGYVLETGDLVLEGAAAELIHNPKVIETYLGLSRKAGVA